MLCIICHPAEDWAELPSVEQHVFILEHCYNKKENQDNTQQLRANPSSRYGKKGRKRAQRSLLKQKP